MEENTRQRTENYISAKNQHPAWILLATRRAPLVLSCLKTLFEKSHDGIPLEEAIQSLSSILIEHVSQEQYDINQDNPFLQASRELREWIKRRLIVERDGRIFATDALVKWSTKTGHRVRVFSSIDFPIRLVVTHHYIRAVLVRCNIQRYSPLLRELHR